MDARNNWELEFEAAGTEVMETRRRELEMEGEGYAFLLF